MLRSLGRVSNAESVQLKHDAQECAQTHFDKNDITVFMRFGLYVSFVVHI